MKLWICLLVLLTAAVARAQPPSAPLALGIIGLEHDQAGGLLSALRGRTDARLAGIVETNRDLIDKYQENFSLAPGLFFTNFADMVRQARPQAVASFTRTVAHRQVVDECAAAGLDVLLEKPLAIDLAGAKKIAAAAKKGGIDVLVDYETAWYPAVQSAYEIARNQRAIGAVRKMVARDGHRGPKEIGVSAPFLEWLTDPTQSGGGALVDFGCYGADLVTWMMDGRRPTSVLAAAQQLKPEVYPKVEDEATIILEYPGVQAIIEASWNWPYEQRELDIFGREGYVLVPEKDVLRVRKSRAPETEIKLTASPAGPALDEISYLVAVARKQIKPSGMVSLDLNLTVMEILDAARESARTGRRVDLTSEGQ